MNYTDYPNAYELALFAENEESIYFSFIVPAIQKLHTRLGKPSYNPEKWFFSIATAAAKQYKKEFGTKFTIEDRRIAALILQDSYMENILEGDI